MPGCVGYERWQEWPPFLGFSLLFYYFFSSVLPAQSAQVVVRGQDMKYTWPLQLETRYIQKMLALLQWWYIAGTRLDMNTTLNNPSRRWAHDADNDAVIKPRSTVVMPRQRLDSQPWMPSSPPKWLIKKLVPYLDYFKHGNKPSVSDWIRSAPIIVLTGLACDGVGESNTYNASRWDVEWYHHSDSSFSNGWLAAESKRACFWGGRVNLLDKSSDFLIHIFIYRFSSLFGIQTPLPCPFLLRLINLKMRNVLRAWAGTEWPTFGRDYTFMFGKLNHTAWHKSPQFTFPRKLYPATVLAKKMWSAFSITNGSASATLSRLFCIANAFPFLCRSLSWVRMYPCHFIVFEIQLSEWLVVQFIICQIMLIFS